MKLYKLLIQESPWQAEDEWLMKGISLERQRRIRRYRQVKDQKLALYSRLLTIAAIQMEMGTQSTLAFSETAKGKPFLVNQPNCQFNVSHSEQRVICGISSQPIGVDVEKIDAVYPAISDRCFHEEEQLRLLRAPSKAQMFYEIWTRKEAFVKWDGSGMAQSLNEINTYAPLQRSQFRSWQEGEYQYGVYSESQETLTLIEVELDWLMAYFNGDR